MEDVKKQKEEEDVQFITVMFLSVLSVDGNLMNKNFEFETWISFLGVIKTLLPVSILHITFWICSKRVNIVEPI